jgi:hypothetical protein
MLSECADRPDLAVLGHLAADVTVQLPALLEPGEQRHLALRLSPAGAPWHAHALYDISPLVEAYSGRLTFAPSPRVRANAGGVLGLIVHNRTTSETIRLRWGSRLGHVLRVAVEEEEEAGGQGSDR